MFMVNDFLKFASELYYTHTHSTAFQPSEFLCISSLLTQLEVAYFILNLKARFWSLLEELMQHPHPS